MKKLIVLIPILFLSSIISAVAIDIYPIYGCGINCKIEQWEEKQYIVNKNLIEGELKILHFVVPRDYIDHLSSINISSSEGDLNIISHSVFLSRYDLVLNTNVKDVGNNIFSINLPIEELKNFRDDSNHQDFLFIVNISYNLSNFANSVGQTGEGIYSFDSRSKCAGGCYITKTLIFSLDKYRPITLSDGFEICSNISPRLECITIKKGKVSEIKENIVYMDEHQNLIFIMMIAIIGGILSNLIIPFINSMKNKSIYCCKKCKINHNPSRDKGKEHLIYK